MAGSPASAARPPRITVFTPTYNRRRTLPRVYESLCAQTYTDFEWLIVDDGSNDGTAELVRSWQSGARPRLEITYVYQANAGKHVAHNRALMHARGEYFAILDSDDWYLSGALDGLMRAWRRIPSQQRAEFSNVEGLCHDARGALIGSLFPRDDFDSDNLSIQWQRRRAGDTLGLYRTDVLREFPFPVEQGGRFVTESLVWNRIAACYRTRFINEVIGGKEYLPDGLSRNAAADVRRKAAQGVLYYREMMSSPRPLPGKVVMRSAANYIRLCLHQRLGVLTPLRTTPRGAACVLMAPVGIALYARDRWRSRLKE